MRDILVVATLLVGCGKKEEAPRELPPAPAAQGVTTKAAWIAAADKLADGTGPIDAAQLAPLMASTLWFTVDANTMTDPDTMAFLLSSHRLTTAVDERGSVADRVAFAVFNLRVYASLIGAGQSFVAKLPASDPARPAREKGIEKMRVGVARLVCDLFYLLPEATAAAQGPAWTMLGASEFYAVLSRDTLQLLLVTLDEKLLPAATAELRPKYQSVRDMVAAAHKANPGATVFTYQPVDPPSREPRTVTVESKPGKFSVSLGNITGASPLAYSDGTEHWIRMKALRGPTFEARCSADIDAADTERLVAAMDGATKRPDGSIAVKTAQRDALIRVTTLNGQGCVVSVDAESGMPLPTALAETFVASLRAVPS